MMDWYSGVVIDDFVVPKDEELSDRLPSPKSWSKWGVSSHESFGFANRCSVMDMDMDMTQDAIDSSGEFSSSEVGMEGPANDGDQCSGLSGGGRMTGKSLNQAAFICDRQEYHLGWLARMEEMDDLFLSSLLEDPPGTVNLNKSSCIYPESQSNMVPADSFFTDMILDSGSISDAQSVESPKNIKPHEFSTSVYWENGKFPASGSITHNSEQKDGQPVKALPVKVLAPTEHNCTNEDVDGQMFIEESVLQELEMVMSQLTYKTRICFRDALYRMSKNSRECTQDETECLSKGTSLWTVQDEERRSEGKMATELETNAIDRAVAILMFNKMDINSQHFPLQASVCFEQEMVEATGPMNYSLNQSQIQGFCHHPVFPADALVPVLDEEYP